jgi:hypothetical protein
MADVHKKVILILILFYKLSQVSLLNCKGRRLELTYVLQYTHFPILFQQCRDFFGRVVQHGKTPTDRGKSLVVPWDMKSRH